MKITHTIKSVKPAQPSEQAKPKKPTQPCPVCNEPIGVVSGSKEAICRNCGFKDPCCE